MHYRRAGSDLFGDMILPEKSASRQARTMFLAEAEPSCPHMRAPPRRVQPTRREVMSFVQQIADAIGTAPVRALDTLSRSIWQGLAAGALTDDDAQCLAELVHARKTAAKEAPARSVQRRVGSRPRFPRFDGATPLLGRLWPSAAPDREPVHPGRASGPRRGRRRGREARRLHAHHRSHRGARRRVRNDGPQCDARGSRPWFRAGRGAPAHGMAQRTQPRHDHVAGMVRMAAVAPKGGGYKTVHPTHTGFLF
jgi:hypothetical protein